MFVVVTMGRPEYHEEIVNIDGVVNNEEEFNRFLDERFPGLRESSARVLNEHGFPSVHYDMIGYTNLTQVRMLPIRLIGQNKDGKA